MKYVFSTLSNDNIYSSYQTDMNNIPVREKSVVIKGGANVVDRKHLITPRGVMTAVSDENYEFLKTIPAFNDHVKDGFITVEESKVDPEVVAANMIGRDDSSPRVEADFEAEGKAAPKTNEGKPDEEE